MTKHAFVQVPVCDLRREPKRRDPNLEKDQLQESQLLFGEAVEIVTPGPQWTQIRAIEQPFWTEAAAWGSYPGWVESRQLSTKRPTPPAEPVLERWRGKLSWATPCSKRVEELSFEQLATPLIGTRYLWGGRSAEGVDCSGLVQLLWSFRGKQLPRNASHQALACSPVDPDQLRADDLIFLGSPKIDHVCLYLGHGRLLEATERTMSVRIVDLDQLRQERGPAWAYSVGRVQH